MASYKKKDDHHIVELQPLHKKGAEKISKNVPKSASAAPRTTKGSTSSGEGDCRVSSSPEMTESEREFAKKLLKAVISREVISIKMALITTGGDVNIRCGMDELTALHFAAALGDLNVVEALLQYKADPHAEDRIGRTPFYVAAVKCNIPCLVAMMRAGADPNRRVRLKSSGDVEHSSSKTGFLFSAMTAPIKIPTLMWDGITALHEACRANSPKCVKVLLDAGADADAADEDGVTPLLLAGAGLDASQKDAITNYEQVVRLLVGKGAKGNAYNDGMANSALLNAVFLGSLTALKLLMDANADPSWSSKNGGRTTAIHEAAGNGRADMLKAMICHSMDVRLRRTLANKPDAVKRTPLHKAAYAGAQDCICLLLECGADLSLKTSTGVSGIEAVMLYVPDSKVFLSSVLDSCITCNIPNSDNPNFAVWLNFSLLAPEVSERQTAVLNAIFTATAVPREYKRTFLLHPLVEAFVRFKWHELRKYFILGIIVYALFVIHLSVYVTLIYIAKDHQGSSNSDHHWFDKYLQVFRYSTIFFATLVLMSVLGQAYIHFRYYMRQLETWTNGLSSIFSIIWMVSEEPVIKNGLHMDLWVLHFVSITLPIAWAGLMLLLGRFPTWGSRALLFAVVLKNVVWTLLVLGCMILGFSFSFFVQFHDVNPDAFGDPWKAFFNTIVMMTGEYEYLEIFNSKRNFLTVTSRVLLFVFIIVASIVLVNLIVGLAVTDTQTMKAESERRSLYKRAEFVDLLECTVAPIARNSALNKTVKVKIHGRTLNNNQANIKILTMEVIDCLIKVAINHKKNKQGSGVTSPGNLSLHHSTVKEEILQNKISHILEQFANEIIQVVQEGQDINVQESLTNRLSTRRSNISSYSSTHMRRVLNQVTTTQHSMSSS